MSTQQEGVCRRGEPGQASRDAIREQELTRGTTVTYSEPWSRGELLRETNETEAHQAAPKTDKTDLARAKVEEGIASLAAALEAGNSEALTAYLDTMSRFHYYSLNNTILIALQRPDATHVAGFNTWKGLGRNVMRGEKGMMILAPVPKRFRAEVEETTGQGEEERTETKEKTVESGVWGFKVVYVFDISQTEGKALRTFAEVKGDPEEHLERLKALVLEQGIALSYNSELEGAIGLSQPGRIEILSGQSPAEEFSVLVHEFAHELLHRDPKRRLATDRKIRETEAEAVSYVVCQAIGLDTTTQHADYIKLYRGNIETLTASLTAIQEAATRILSGIEHQAKKGEPGSRVTDRE